MATMQRLCARLRSLSLQNTHTITSLSSSSSRRLLHHSRPTFLQPLDSPTNNCCFKPFLDAGVLSTARCFPVSVRSPASSLIPLSLVQVRYVSSKERKLRRKPMTPVTSKLKKTKMKAYSSYKSRFRTLNDGTIRRWKEGKRHNAHLKSKKSKRRLRQPALVPPAYAKVMKKLNFYG